MMIAVHEVGVADVLVAGFAFTVGVYAAVTARAIWPLRAPGPSGALTRGLVFELLAFTGWSVEVFSATLYEWHVGSPAPAFAQGLANLDRLTFAVSMAALLMWALPAVAKKSNADPTNDTSR